MVWIVKTLTSERFLKIVPALRSTHKGRLFTFSPAGIDTKFCPVDHTLLYIKTLKLHISNLQFGGYLPAFHSRERCASACFPQLARFQHMVMRIKLFCMAAELVFHYRQYPRQHKLSRLKGGFFFTNASVYLEWKSQYKFQHYYVCTYFKG